MKAKTIGQFKILEWVEEHFVPGSVSIEFSGENSAAVVDATGDYLNVTYIADSGIEVKQTEGECSWKE